MRLNSQKVFSSDEYSILRCVVDKNQNYWRLLKAKL